MKYTKKRCYKTKRKCIRTRKRGGMIRVIARPVGKAVITLGENVGKDYLQKKLPKVVHGINDDISLSKNPNFIISGVKPLRKPKPFGKLIDDDTDDIEDKENSQSQNAKNIRKKIILKN